MYLLPSQSVFSPQDSVRIDILDAPTADAPVDIAVYHLGRLVKRQRVYQVRTLDLGTLPAGGYGVETEMEIDGVHMAARTALDIRDPEAPDRACVRYGFVASYEPGKDIEAVVRLVRRLHLTDVQFYDWAYRHADLLGGGSSYRDALGQEISLSTVRSLVRSLGAIGSHALGYAAVYGVGNEEWDRWNTEALLQADSAAYALGDFLQIVDPAGPRWLHHLCSELENAAREIGFPGFHLDQYGYPKVAMRADGVPVDMAESFATMIGAVHEAIPDSRLIFNNVNDFPTWRTAALEQDAVYIEPWEPNTTLADLAALVTRARSAGQGRPVILAAYQSCYRDGHDDQFREACDTATALTMATLFSHGATQLLAGEDGHILVDPYYVRNQVAAPHTLAMLTRWYDFLVEHDALLMGPDIADITSSVIGAYNDDLDVSYSSAASGSTEGCSPVTVTAHPSAGAVWRRVTRTDEGLVIHLINLVSQEDTAWDSPRQPVVALAGGALRLRSVRGRVHQVLVADPDRLARLRSVPVRLDGNHAVADLPPLHVWQTVLVRPCG